MANERPHAYDFFMIVCGPVPLSERMARPEAALAIATGDAAARERAWKRLETATADAGGCRRFGRNGTFGAPQGLKSGYSADPCHGIRRLAPGWLWPSLWCKAWRFYGLMEDAPAAQFLTAVSASNS